MALGHPELAGRLPRLQVSWGRAGPPNTQRGQPAELLTSPNLQQLETPNAGAPGTPSAAGVGAEAKPETAAYPQSPTPRAGSPRCEAGGGAGEARLGPASERPTAPERAGGTSVRRQGRVLSAPAPLAGL